MRPRQKKVLLIAWTDIDLSLWRLRLEIHGYKVTATSNPLQAAAVVASEPDTDVVLAQSAANKLLATVKPRFGKVIVFDGRKADKAKTMADVFLMPEQSDPLQVLAAVWSMADRKRDPRSFTPEYARDRVAANG